MSTQELPLDLRGAPLPWHDPVPTDPASLMEAFVPILVQHLIGGEPVIYLVTVSEGQVWWLEARGTLPCSVDDLARTVAQKLGAQAVVVAESIPVPAGAEAESAWSVGCETPGERGPYVVLVKGTDEGPRFRLALRPEQRPGPRWLHVAPLFPVELFVEAGGWGVPEGEA